MIFASRQIQEKCPEQNQNLFLIFVDLTKAFDSVNREGLWRILSCRRAFQADLHHQILTRRDARHCA